MSETAQLVVDLANVLATHTHPNVGAISQAGAVSTISGQMGRLKHGLMGSRSD